VIGLCRQPDAGTNSGISGLVFAGTRFGIGECAGYDMGPVLGVALAAERVRHFSCVSRLSRTKAMLPLDLV
jgi:hypothetical protein